MTLLTICNNLAENVGLAVTEAVMTSPKREWAEAVVMANAAGDELARRVDFGALFRMSTLTGDGTDKEFDLGTSFSRLIQGIAVTTGIKPVRPLTQPEWASLVAVQGTPRYFKLDGNKLRVWPYLAIGETVVIRYQSKNWCGNGTALWNADSDTALVDEGILTKCLIVRWRRQKGMDYSDYEAEYEAALSDVARFDDRSRL
jgi:hypothetical protein